VQRSRGALPDGKALLQALSESEQAVTAPRIAPPYKMLWRRSFGLGVLLIVTILVWGLWATRESTGRAPAQHRCRGSSLPGDITAARSLQTARPFATYRTRPSGFNPPRRPAHEVHRAKHIQVCASPRIARTFSSTPGRTTSTRFIVARGAGAPRPMVVGNREQRPHRMAQRWFSFHPAPVPHYRIARRGCAAARPAGALPRCSKSIVSAKSHPLHLYVQRRTPSDH